MAPRRWNVVLIALMAMVAAVLPLTVRTAEAHPEDRVISTLAGTGTFDDMYVEGQPAISVNMPRSPGVAALPGGGFLIGQFGGNCVRKVNAAGLMTTVAGTCGQGNGGYAGDGLPATNPAVRMRGPTVMALLDGGGFLVAEELNFCVRKVNARGIISTFAGTCGVQGNGPDGGLATATPISRPTGMLVVGDGVLIADFDYGCIRRVGTNGRISTFAGVCGSGFQFNPANGTPKAATAMGGPIGLTRLPGGAILYAEQFAHRVRKIEEGKVTTVAGVGANGFYAGSFGGDGGPATAARLNLPSDVQAAVGGGFLISDRWNNRVRWVSDDGMIRTIAGTGPDMLPTTPNFGGDGGPATAAKLNGPHAIDVRHDGSILIADLENRRIRQVSPLETKNTAPPTITGAPSVGQTLTCNPGTWTNNPAFTYQWISDGDRIRGATGPTYVVRDRDRDDRIRCVVEASTYSGTERARSGSVRVP